MYHTHIANPNPSPIPTQLQNLPHFRPTLTQAPSQPTPRPLHESHRVDSAHNLKVREVELSIHYGSLQQSNLGLRGCCDNKKESKEDE